MSKNLFPIYDTHNLSGSLLVTFKDGSADLINISLDHLTLMSGKRFIDNEEVQLSIVLERNEISLTGTILNFKYIRETKKYEYIINLQFESNDMFLRWFAIIKGIHRARFKQ